MANKIDTVVWDADNTLWDWISMHLEGMRVMSAKIAEITKVPEDEVRQSMGRVYEEAGTFDRKSLVQEMDIVADWAAGIEPERTKVARVLDLGFAVHNAYTNSRANTFQTYTGVSRTLRELEKVGVKNVILSDAPTSKLIRRSSRFGIDKHVETIFGQPDPMLPEERKRGEHLRHYEEGRREAGLYTSKARVVILKNQKKPDVDLAGILEKKASEVKDSTLVVGDNFAKDVGTADNNNCYAALARYGASDVPSLSGLADFAPPSVVTRNAAGIDLSKENLAMIQRMGPKLIVVDKVREVLQFVLEHNNRK